MEDSIRWIIKDFSTLSVKQLYDVLALRMDVFMLEQKTSLSECDYKDQKSRHILGYQNEKLAAYARLLPPDLSYKNPSIGRVVIAKEYRKEGLGTVLMKKALSEIQRAYPDLSVEISAQAHLKDFYVSLGFQPVDEGRIYFEAGIPHVHMMCKAIN